MKRRRIFAIGASVVVVLAVVLALVARLVYLLHKPFWFDELFTLWVSGKSAGGIWKALALDSGPPLFYWIEVPLTAVARGGRSDIAARLIPFVSVALLWGWNRKPPYGAGHRYVLLLAASPLLFCYAGEARQYGLLALLSFVLFLAVFRAGATTKSLVAAGIVAAALCWTHYLGLLVTGSSILICLIRKRWPQAAAQTAGALTFAIWFPTALNQPAGALRWSGETFSGSFAGLLEKFAFWGNLPPYFTAGKFAAPLGGALLGAAILAVLFSTARRHCDETDAIFFAFLPLCLAALASVWRPVYFSGRTEMATLPVALWAIARSARRSTLLRGLTNISIAAGILSIVWILIRPAPRPPYSVTADAVAQTVKPGDVVFAAEEEYLPLRLLHQRGKLVADLYAIPREGARHPGWFTLGLPPDAPQEQQIVESILHGLAPGGRAAFAIPPDPPLRGLVAPLLRRHHVEGLHPPGGYAALLLLSSDRQ